LFFIIILALALIALTGWIRGPATGVMASWRHDGTEEKQDEK
jgi:hypothetical protein